MTDREAFKAAFLERAAQAGWTAQELADRAEGLAGELEKTALLQEVVNGVSGLVNAGTNLASTLGSWAIPVGVAAPLVAGGGLGYAAAELRNAETADPDEVKRDELAAEYDRQLDELKRRKARFRGSLAARPAGRPVL